MIEVRCLHDLSAAGPYREAINALNLASVRPDPFSTFEYYANILHATELSTWVADPRSAGQAGAGTSGLPGGGKLWLLLAFSGDRLVGYLALKRCVSRVFGVPAAKLDLLTAYVADRPHLVSLPEHTESVSAAFFSYLLSRKKDWSLLEFQQQDLASTLLSPPATAAAKACRIQRWPNAANGIIPVNWATLGEYFAAFSKKFRSNVSRQMRALMAAGEVEVLSSSDSRSLTALFELYRSIEERSWKAQTGAAFARDRTLLKYYEGLMHSAQPMQIVIQVLLLDGIPIAGLINGAFDNNLYALHIVYDERLGRLAPGSAILLLGVRLAIAARYKTFNLLWGYGYYKSRWLAQMSETQSLQIYRVGTPYYWRRVLGDLKRRWLDKPVGDDTALSNPARREIEKAEPEAGDAPLGNLASPAERERYAGLIAKVRAGAGEFLSASALAAAMPFESQSKADARPRTSGRTQPRELGLA